MIQIAIMGLGTVGTGVAKVVAENARQIERKLGEPLQVKTILVRHFKDGPYRQLMTDDFTKIEEDHAIRVVVETIGGVEAAYEYTKRALNAGKHVVTANKQLVAEKGAELLALAKKRGVNYLFEASVGGGIPVLHPLTQCMAANRIDEVYGILNGTTNYILTRMVRPEYRIQPDSPDPIVPDTGMDAFQLPEELPELPFVDVASNIWYYPYIQAAYAMELMNGMGNDRFTPNGTVQLSQTVAVAVRIYEKYWGIPDTSSEYARPWYTGPRNTAFCRTPWQAAARPGPFPGRKWRKFSTGACRQGSFPM